MYLAVVLVGLLTLWWPDYDAWGAMIAGLMTALGLWLCWRTVSVNRTAPGNPAYLVLLAPAAILTYHLSTTGLGLGGIPRDSGLVNGALNMSFLLHLALLSLGILLSQSLLPQAMARAGVVRISGATMIAAGVLVGFRGDAEPVRQAMSLVGLAGVAVWLEPVWRPSLEITVQGFAPPPHRQVFGVLSLISGAAACVVLAWISPSAAVIAAVGSGLTLITAAVVFSRRSRKLLIAGAVLSVAGGFGAISRVDLPRPLNFNGPLLGAGERAFGTTAGTDGQAIEALRAADSGLHVLSGTIGLCGAVLTVAGLAICLLTFLVRARRDHSGDKARCAAWTVSALLCTAAMLSPGGLFIPAVALAFGLTWGLAAEAAGRASKPRPGAIVLVLLGGVMVLIGVTRSGGLLVWSAQGFRPGQDVDKLLHAAFGMLLSMTLAWLLGSRSVVRGLAAIALACLLGGAGEMIQHMTAIGRSVEWTDWGAHAAGCLAAAPIHLLCIGARQCESPDAPGKDPGRFDPYIG